MIRETDIDYILGCKTKEEIVTYLENSLITIDEFDIYGRTLLTNASIHGKLEVAKILIELGADINSIDSSGWTALIHASFQNKADIIQYLVQSGADVNGYQIDAQEDEDENAEENEENTDDTTDSDDEGYLSPIIYATIEKAFDAIKTLINLNADIEARDENGKTPLALSVSMEGCENITLYLIYSGADIDTQDEDGMTPLMTSAEQKDYFSVILLLAYNANKSITDSEGLSAYDYIGRNYISLLDIDRSYLDQMKLYFEGYINQTYRFITDEYESPIETDSEAELLGDSDSDIEL